MTRILVVTPAPPRSRKGNRLTANRWADQLRELGYQVEVAEEYIDQECELLFALHARKSSRSIERFHRQKPSLPIVLTLTGTDLYGDIRTSRSAKRSLHLATRLVLLQDHGLRELTPSLRKKAFVVRQSALPPKRFPPPLKSVFEVCVSGHLRSVKDPFRAAHAARLLPEDSQIRITHIGAALTKSMATQAIREMERNPRYHWLGEKPHAKSLEILARSRLLVLSSKAEGGANVISESLAARTPVLASKISGTIGLLGGKYPGYFPVGDTQALARLLLRSEIDSDFVERLQLHCQKQARLLTPQREREALEQVMDGLVP